MDYYLGVDIGTTAVKALAFSQSGEVLAIQTVTYGMQHPQPGWSEQNPDEILEGVIASINKVVSEMLPLNPALVSFSAAMHSLLLTNLLGKPISPCIIWADNRSEEITTNLRESKKGNSFYHKSGVPIHSTSPLCKLLWLKENQPDIFNSAAKFISTKEYVFHQLFAKELVDISIAAASGLLNIQNLKWDEDILEYIGISESKLSPIVSTKHTFNFQVENSKLLIPLLTPIIIGASDGALANFSSASAESNNLVVSMGTSGAVRLSSRNISTDQNMRTFCYPIKEDEYIIGGATNNGAVVMQWLKDSILRTEDTFENLFSHAESVSAGSEGLIFLPYILGERAPIYNSNAKGVFFGLNIQHRQAHLIRAAMEGITFCLFSIGKLLMENTSIKGIYASGGFAKSSVWLQMLTDVFNLNVFVAETVESSALGAVKLACESLELPFTISQDFENIYKPNETNHLIYKKSFQKFERIYEALKDEMN